MSENLTFWRHNARTR